MAMVVQHNMTAMNTNRQLGISTNALAKSTEKLSSGYRINRAADDAAGLAISEKMRSQIRGLDQASTNASDGISMIQTAEGALNESHSILQRMRELAVQAANGTETDEDRDNIQDEIEQLQEELDRIASDTEFNTMKLLDGSLSAAGPGITGAGPKFGEYDGELGAFITSDVAGVVVKTTTFATTGGESAIWDPSGKTLTLNLTKNVTYNQTEIDKLVAAAKQEDSGAYGTPANVSVQFANGVYTAKEDTDGVPTAAGKKSSSSTVSYREVVDASGLGAGATNSASLEIKSAVNGLQVNFHTIEGEAYAEHDTATKTVNVYLTKAEVYDQDQLNNLLVEAGVTDTTILTEGTVTAANAAAAANKTITVDVPLANSYTVHVAPLTVESTILGAGLDIVSSASVAFGKETAVWDEDENKLTLTLSAGTDYTQEQINDILERTVDTSTPAKTVDSPIKLTLDDGAVCNSDDVAGAPVVTAVKEEDLPTTTLNPATMAVTPVTSGVTITNDTTEYVGANVINITSNRYGADHNVIINLEFTAAAGKECAELDLAPEYDMGKNGVINTVTQPAIYTLSLQSGKEYTADEIEDYLAAAGLDMTVELSGNEKNNGTDEPNTLFVTRNDVKATIELRGGAGIGDEDAFLTQANYGYSTTTGGIILQVGANEGQTMQFSIDDMSAAALGVNGSRVDVTTQKQASNSLGFIDEAIQKVSKQRSLLGAVQNRLEHTIANLDNTAENLQDAESGIRDVDMASEMVTMSKYNILQQAGQSMLAQANQATQGVLSLLQS